MLDSPFWDIHFLYNDVREFTAALVAFALTFASFWLLKNHLLRAAKKGSGPHSFLGQLLTYLLARTMRLFIWAVALAIALRFLSLPQTLSRIVHSILFIAIAWQVGRWLFSTVEVMLHWQQTHQPSTDVSWVSAASLLRVLARVVMWSLVVLLVLENLGVDVTALVAGLGIGGIAVALAARTLLADLFASLSIVLDKPFAVGDNIVLAEVAGKVERIGIKSTHVRTVNGEVVVVSNGNLLKSNLRNFGRLDERRGTLCIRVAFETPLNRLRQVHSLIKETIDADTRLRFERCHFKGFGAATLLFEVVFVVLDPKANDIGLMQGEINARLTRSLDRAAIEVGYPAQLILSSLQDSPTELNISSSLTRAQLPQAQ